VFIEGEFKHASGVLAEAAAGSNMNGHKGAIISMPTSMHVERTLAHEMGHVFGLSHDLVHKDNLMGAGDPTEYTDTLDDSQVGRARNIITSWGWSRTKYGM
jgi:hypothetical protein